MNRLLRASVVVAALAFLVLVPVAGGDTHPVLALALLAVAGAAAVRPASHAPGGLLLGLGALWLFAVPRAAGLVDGWLLLAATLLLVVHLAGTLASYGPSAFEPGADLLRLWGRRMVVLLAVTLAVWVLARAADRIDVRDEAARWAVGLGLVVVLGWVALLSARLARP